jgi:hypothetical protein
MSKLDAQRAMREANWAARQKAAPAQAPVPEKAASAQTRVTASSPEPVATGLCGHRAIGGNTCTRPLGHSEKNHRYK